MQSQIDTLLLLALPASGKSELRRYLAWLDDDVVSSDFGLGPTVQLDDYPYVHFMRRIDEVLTELSEPARFFHGQLSPFKDGRDWATLIGLLNEDYAVLGTTPPVPPSPTLWLLERIDRARQLSGAPAPFDDLPPPVIDELASVLDGEIAEFAEERSGILGSYEAGTSTVILEFARGGPEGTEPPLPEPHGYAYSLRFLSRDILRRAAALYVWVTPEESRRRNDERAKPGLEGDASILHHGVPESVMRGDYGTDDFTWLMGQGGGDTIELEFEDATYLLPAAVFDNRVDHTSFLRADPAEWDDEAVDRLHTQLVAVFAELE